MKLATYNIWNDEAGMPYRLEQITDEITGINADIICLQEVADLERHKKLAELCGYAYSHYKTDAGLSILSKLPMTPQGTNGTLGAMDKTADFAFGTAAFLRSEKGNLFIINVHLPWESASLREKAIVDIVNAAAGAQADYCFLLGDFNCSEVSSVHRFLTNEQSLLGSDAYFFDLADAFAGRTGKKALPTLNFRENPRWGVVQPENTIEVNGRFDWILLKNPYPQSLPVLKDYAIFGTKVSPRTKLAASDHYGVFVEIEF